MPGGQGLMAAAIEQFLVEPLPYCSSFPVNAVFLFQTEYSVFWETCSPLTRKAFSFVDCLAN
jgi:hypothetical protein